MPTAVYIGRFEPPHDGHLATMHAALARHGRLLVLCGSANLARSSKNPWTAPERARMIRAALAQSGADLRRVRIRPLPDEFDPERWAARVRQTVRQPDTVLVGFEKDASSRYLHWFPQWTFEASPVLPGLSATDLRAAYFAGRPLGQVPPATAAFLEAFRTARIYRRLRTEHFALEAQKEQLGSALRREIRFFRLENGHVWLNRRGGPIGQGLWAWPGWAIDENEAAPAAARVFDAPTRSLLGPSVAYVVRAAGGGEPVPLAVALSRPHRFFEDHHVILQRLLEEEGAPPRPERR